MQIGRQTSWDYNLQIHDSTNTDTLHWFKKSTPDNSKGSLWLLR